MTIGVTSNIFNNILGVKKVAEFMGVHQRTIYRLVNEGKMPGFKLGGKWVFDRKVIRQWLANEMIKNCLQR